MTAVDNRRRLYEDIPMEPWDDFAPPLSATMMMMDATDNNSLTHGSAGREVSLESSDSHWNDDDSIFESSRLPFGNSNNKSEIITVHWDVQNNDDESMLDMEDGALDIILGVSVPDNHQEPDEEYYHGLKSRQVSLDALHNSNNDDDDHYIEELYFQANQYLDNPMQFGNDNIPPELQASFRKRRADLAACMEATKKTRRVLQQHMKQRGSLARVLADIEKSSQHVQRMVIHHDHDEDPMMMNNTST